MRKRDLLILDNNNRDTTRENSESGCQLKLDIVVVGR